MQGPPKIDALHCDQGFRRPTIVASLLADVLQGRIRAGQHLVTQELAGRFGVSHTPIREALIALAGIGVVDLQPNRGAIVRRVGAKDIREICQVRRVLECEATRTACGRIDPAALRALGAGFRQQHEAGASARDGIVAEAQALDSRLHDLIAASCGNLFLANELTRLKILFRAFRDAAWEHVKARNDYQRLAEESREHLAIVEALLACDGREASRAMSRHILGGARLWRRALGDAVPPEADQRSPRIRREERAR